ncbi:MAG: tyrosine-type recombinase/integrase [Paracoccus sp. (in: a-proteobacteria)]|uniref:tyrosine-type recombinase/integrase n=1 Tax=Paracoccus sp. TaxID=267 RepID=UPI0026DEC9DC|nr:site-specific integrase [Paracoccus sp. (in: a-proteobacteria)]MDO5622912.1 tyrosine-type recombinase/integrase [Paracoccus sp. (in: a-proteobacteria)]
MPNLKLTKRTVETLSIKEKDYIKFDTDLTGFGVRVMPSGKRFFLIQYRRHGRTRRIMIGQFGPITVEGARREAQRMLGEVRGGGGGGDPADRRDQLRQSMTVEQLGERFLKEHVEVRCKPTTQAEYRRSVELFIDPFFGNQRVRTVTSADVADLHGTYAHIPYQANRTLGVLSKMMSLAELWGIRDRHSNPCEDVKRYPEHKRERFLSPSELHELGKVLGQSEADGSESSYAIAAFRLLLLTGCRLSEIQKLQWKHVDLDHTQINRPDSKTGKRAIHLGNAAVEQLANLRPVAGNPYVIVGKVKGRHLTDLQRPWRRIRKAAGLDDVRIHDLRHTFASGGLLVGESLPVIGKLLGHTQVQTTARYAHLAADPVNTPPAESRWLRVTAQSRIGPPFGGLM